MKIITKLLCALLILLLFSKCASLTKSQLTEVNAFGCLTQKFSACPGSLYGSYLLIHEKALMYSANAITNPADHYKSINSAYQLKKSLESKSHEMDLTFQIIDKYGEALACLTSPEHSALLDTASKNLGPNLDGLITKYNSINTGHQLPTGIGGAFAELITLGGEQYIRSKQAEEVKDIVQKADPMIAQLMDAISSHFKGPLNSPTGTPATFKQLIDNERNEVRQDYLFFLGYNADTMTIHPMPVKQNAKKTNNEALKDGRGKSKKQEVLAKDTVAFPVYSGTIQRQRFATLANDRDCFRMLEDLDRLEELYNQTLTAVEDLKKAHHQLLLDIQEKKNLKEMVEELQVYGDDVKNMYTTLKAIKN